MHTIQGVSIMGENKMINWSAKRPSRPINYVLFKLTIRNKSTFINFYRTDCTGGFPLLMSWMTLNSGGAGTEQKRRLHGVQLERLAVALSGRFGVCTQRCVFRPTQRIMRQDRD